MLETNYSMKGKVWLFAGGAGWHFVTLPKEESAEIRAQFSQFKTGWGSLPVTAAIGQTRWKTSIFPDKKRDAYVLPLKKEVRAKENIEEGDEITFSIAIRM